MNARIIKAIIICAVTAQAFCRQVEEHEALCARKPAVPPDLVAVRSCADVGRGRRGGSDCSEDLNSDIACEVSPLFRPASELCD